LLQRIVSAELGSRRVGTGLVKVGDHDVSAFAPTCARDFLADAARGTSDDYNFV
jgi:hypothetical protein